MKQRQERIQYFSSGFDSSLVKIIVFAVVFHLVVVMVCVVIHNVDIKQPSKKIPVFTMVQVSQPAPPSPPMTQPPPTATEPKVEMPKPEPPPKKVSPKSKPKVNKKLPPAIKPKPKEKPEVVEEEPKPMEQAPEPTQEPVTEPVPEPTTNPKDDFPMDDMDLPVAMEAPSLNPVGAVDMDPLLRAYLNQLKKNIMNNFKPPKDLKVGRDAKTTVQFTVDRSGKVSAIVLKHSSGNTTWDHLSVRAVEISKVPELPDSYRAPNLVLNFNFTPN